MNTAFIKKNIFNINTEIDHFFKSFKQIDNYNLFLSLFRYLLFSAKIKSWKIWFNLE